MACGDEATSSDQEEEFDDAGEDDSGDDNADDDPIRDPHIRALLQVPKVPPSTASMDDLREALSELQLQYAELSSKYRETCLENLTLKAANKKQRNRHGGKPPAELVKFSDKVYLGGKKSVVCYTPWTTDDAFDARTRPNIELLSPTRFINDRNQQRARQAEVFDAIGGLDLEKNRGLAQAMGSVIWIKNAYLASAQKQRSHLIDSAKKYFYLCLPESLRHLPIDNPGALADNEEAATLRGGQDDFMPPFIFPFTHNGEAEYMMRSPIMVRLLIACLVGKSGLTTRRVWNESGTGNTRVTSRKGKTAAKKGGKKTKAELWGVVGMMMPEWIALMFIILRFLLSGDLTFIPNDSYNYAEDFDWWKERLIREWDQPAIKATRQWWAACVWNGHDPDVLELEITRPSTGLTPAQRRAEALLAQLRNPAPTPDSVSSPVATSPSPSSALPASSSSRSGSAAPAPAAPASRTTGSAVSAASGRSRTTTQAAPKPDSDLSDVEDADVEDLEEAIAAMDVDGTNVARRNNDDREPASEPEPAQQQARPKPKKRVPKPAADDVEEDRAATKPARAAASKNAEPSGSRRAAVSAPTDQDEEVPAPAKAAGRPKRAGAGSRKKA